MTPNIRDIAALIFAAFIVILPMSDNSNRSQSFAAGAFIALLGIWLIYHVSFS